MCQTNKKAVLKQALWALPAILAIILFCIFERNTVLVSAAVSGFSSPARNLLGTVSALFPFSVMEVLYAAAIAWLIIFIVLSVVKTVKSDNRLICIAKRVFILVIVALYIFSGYLWLWGIDYRGVSFTEQADLSSEGISVDALYAVTAFFVKNAMMYADSVPRDTEGHFTASPDEFLPDSVTVYESLQEEFPFLVGTCREPKQMVFSKVMSYMDFTGVFFPFTGESNLNTDSPACFIPSTAAHELAHQLGVTSEQECNFLSIAACLTSDDPIYIYSGYLSGSVHLMNALLRADADKWAEIRSLVSGSMLTDLRDNSEYWSKFDTPVADVSGKVYDGYLKANGEELGIRSYGACVDLLVNYYYPTL